MGTVTITAVAGLGKPGIDNEARDITDLWAEALREYKGIVGFSLKPTFVSADSMIANGVDAMNNFHHFRHDEKKIDKLRSLFMANIDFVEKGAGQLIAAATPAFPPAAAIGTALTLVLSACRSVSADYDVVTAFFEDMNSFLQRTTILVSRSPKYSAWQQSLMNVFTSFLKMCGFAHKYIQKGRFKKWVVNLVYGEDADLASSRKAMDTSLGRLQSATEFAILGNTEELQKMNSELRENQEAHLRLAENQSIMLQAMLAQQNSIQDDMKRLLSLLEQQKKGDKVKSKPSRSQNKVTANRVRSFLAEVPGPDAEVRSIRESFVPDTSTWIFDDPAWTSWEKLDESGSPSLLMIRGPPGIGKSHLAVSSFDRLRQLATADEERQVCVAHFHCKESIDFLKFCSNGLLSTVLQISEQNTEVRQRLEGELAKEVDPVDQHDSWDIWSKLIVPIFDKESKYRLYMVMDGLDELDSDDERIELLRCAQDIEKNELGVKMLCTARSTIRPDFRVQGSVEICVTKEKIVPDMRRIVWNRLQSRAHEYRGLAKFSKHVKQRIASRMEEVADSLLYAEHMLRYLSRIARDSSVIKELEDDMPKDIVDLFTTMLSQSQRRTPIVLFSVMKRFLAWVSFCFRPLTLDEANVLVNVEGEGTGSHVARSEGIDIEEEIQTTYSRFLQIGDTTKEVDEEIFSPTTMMKDFSIDEVSNAKPQVNDDQLEIKFCERSMREFFSGALKEEESLRTPRSAAHRTIFMDCYRVIKERAATERPSKVAKSQSLYEYAIQHCMHHWTWIDLKQHTTEENFEVVQSFAFLMTDRKALATGLEALGGDNLIGDLMDVYYEKWRKQLKRWSEWYNESALTLPAMSSTTIEFWSDAIVNAPLSLARCHVENWFTASDAASARKSYRFARGAVKICTGLVHLLDKDYDDDVIDEAGDDMDVDDGAQENHSKEEILGIFNAFDIKKTSNAHFAVAVLLNLRGNREDAIKELETAIEMCHDPVEQFRNYDFLAFINVELNQNEDAIRYSNLSLDKIDGIPATSVCRAYVTRAKALSNLENNKEAAESYRRARLYNPDQVPSGRVLVEEIIAYLEDEDFASLMDTLQEWKPVERLTWMTWAYDWDEWLDPQFLTIVYVAAFRSGKVDLLVEVLEEAIQSLDTYNSGAPLRNNLAFVHWRLRANKEAARAILNAVLHSSSEGYPYKLTEQSPSDTVCRAVNMMTDILYDSFQRSTRPQEKATILEEVKLLRQMPLFQAVQIFPSDQVAHLIVLARMLQKIGPAIEYEAVIEEAFACSYKGLVDAISTNDSVAANHLARVVHLAGLQRHAEILNSAQFYIFDNSEEGSQEADTATEADDEVDENGSEAEVDEDAASENGTIPGSDPSPQPEPQSATAGMSSNITSFEDDVYATDDTNSNNGAEKGSNGVTGNLVGTKTVTTDAAAHSVAEAEEAITYDLNPLVSYTCKGQCLDRVTWNSWKSDEPMYQCLFCTESRLCQECYDIRMKCNVGHRSNNVHDFCCSNGQYMKGPVKGWQGISDGIIYIDGEKPKPFKQFAEEVLQQWNTAWTEFWRG